MNQAEFYRKLQDEYRHFKVKAIGYNATADETAEAVARIPELESQLLEIGLANGLKLKDVKRFFSEVESEGIFAIGYTPG